LLNTRVSEETAGPIALETAPLRPSIR